MNSELNLIKAFLALPVELLPSATWADEDDMVAGSAWEVLRAVKDRRTYMSDFPMTCVDDACCGRILLSAAHDDWYQGVYRGTKP